MWKNFPNDADLKDKYGTFTYSMKSKLWSTLVENNREDFSQFIQGDVDVDAFRDFAVDHVSFHEYGHNIFWNKHDSVLEETKPDMFDFLHIYKQNLDTPFSNEQIKNFLDYLVITLIRRFKHDGDVSREKYIICQRVVMRALQDMDWNNPLIYWDENDRIWYNIDSEAFADFLEKMNQTLFMIKQIYESEQLDNTQDDFLKQLFADTDADVKKIYNRVHKKSV